MTPKTTNDSGADLLSRDLLSVQEVASMIGVSVKSIYNYRRRGELPSPIRIGPRVTRWPRQMIRDWIADSPRQASPKA